MSSHFSVSICVYAKDHPKYFEEALLSIYKQTVLPSEVVLLVDGEVPNSINQVIDTFSQQHGMKVFRLPTNTGHGNARKECLSHCTNELVAIADADDINREDRFEKQLAAFSKNPALSIVGSNCYHFSGSVNNILNKETMPESDAQIKQLMKTRCPITQATVMFKKSAVIDAGGYLDWYHAEDYYLWLRMYLSGAIFENIPEELVYVRSDEKQMDRRGGVQYFKSLQKLYQFMRNRRIIGFWLYWFNVLTRFVMQVLMPTKLRTFVRKRFL